MRSPLLGVHNGAAYYLLYNGILKDKSVAGGNVLMLDEPSLGLAPLIVREVLNIVASLRGMGVSVLLVEQNARAALQVAEHGHSRVHAEPAIDLLGERRCADRHRLVLELRELGDLLEAVFLRLLLVCFLYFLLRNNLLAAVHAR